MKTISSRVANLYSIAEMVENLAAGEPSVADGAQDPFLLYDAWLGEGWIFLDQFFSIQYILCYTLLVLNSNKLSSSNRSGFMFYRNWNARLFLDKVRLYLQIIENHRNWLYSNGRLLLWCVIMMCVIINLILIIITENNFIRTYFDDFIIINVNGCIIIMSGTL